LLNLASKSRQFFGALVLLTVLVTAAGVYSLVGMPTSVYPEVAFPRIVAIAELPGTSIDLMELSVTRPLENAVSTVPGVERVQSETIRGSSELSIHFAGDTNMRAALESVRGRIATMSADLPKGISLVVEQQTPSVFPIISIDLSGGTSPAMLRDYAVYTLRPLLKVKDVAYVTVSGGDEREIVVEPDPSALASAGLSLDDFCQQLQAGNAMQAAGKIDFNRQAVGVLGQSIANTPDQIARQVISSKAGNKLRVDDVARVRLWHEDRTQAVSGMNLQRERTPVVSLSIFRQVGGNTLTVANALDEEIKRIRPMMPRNIEMHVVYDQARFVRESVANVRDAILIGGFGSVLVLLLFLRSLRATLISAVTIPVTIAITFLFLRYFKQGLNLMSMGGLAIAIGLVIDDTVVVIENICRHLANRKSPEAANPAAAVDSASREITGAVVGSTLTTVTVFVPLAFISGMVGQFFTSLSMALCTAVLVSMVLSLTLIPVAAARLLKPGSIREPGRIFNAFANAYEYVLRRALRFPRLVVLAALAVIPLIWLLYRQLDTGLLPNMDEGTFILDYFLPEGSSLAETDRIAGQIEDILRDEKHHVAAYTRRTGAENGFFATQMFRGDFTVVLADRKARPPITEIMDAVRGEVKDRFPQIRVDTTQVMQDELSDLAGATKPIEIKIFGPDMAELRKLAVDAGEILDSAEVKAAGLSESDNKVHEGNPDLFFKVDPVQAAAVGLTTSQIQDQVRTALFGQVTNTVKQGDRLLNIRVRLPDALRSDRDRLATLPITTPSGKVVPLEQLVHFEMRRTPVESWRENQQPGIDVTGDLEDADKLGAVVKAIEPKLRDLQDSLKQRPGYRIELAGQYESQQESFHSLTMMLVVATTLVFLLLAFQFRSLVLPLLIFLTQPLSLGSAMLALWITSTPLNISSYMGAILLVGLDVKNGIILIEYIEQLLAEDWQLTPALLHAGRVRFRPILMTSLAAILGLLPLALDIGIGPGGGPGAQMQRPLAIAVIGGLLANMLFTRMIIPVGYLALAGKRRPVKVHSAAATAA
jgi:CzcA family heavy metal efflux pump